MDSQKEYLHMVPKSTQNNQRDNLIREKPHNGSNLATRYNSLKTSSTILNNTLSS